MRKRILSILLTLCMVLALIPTTMVAYASETHSHCICGASHEAIGDHTAADVKDFTAWTSTTSLPDTAGNHYLTADVTISGTWKPVDGTVLCLNGHTITCTGDGIDAITINSGVSFTLTDCKTGNEMGKITHETGKKGSGVYNKGTFTMYGGNITGNTATSEGGGVSMFTSTFTMYGGSITGNTATSGGGVSIWGTFTMSGGSITGNTATSEGGGVSMFASTFTMSGGSITGNTATSGGGVCLYGTFTMSGGSITGNTATSGGGVCYTWSTDSFTVSGNVNISNNNKITSGETRANNVNFKSAIIIDGALANESSIGVNWAWSPWDTFANVTGANGADYSSNFTSDDTYYVIYNDSSSNTIKLKMHDHVGVKIDGQAATCTAGWKDYYKCSVCNKYFKEQTCTTEITDIDAWKTGAGKIAALGHDWKYSANGAVLTASCDRKSTCGVTDKTLTLSATSPAYSGNAAAINIGTTEERTAWEAAGFTLPTTVEHYNGTTKLDSAPTTAGTYTAKVTYEGATTSVKYTITDKEPSTPEIPNYRIIDGADGTFTINTDGTYTIRANGDFSKFVSVEVDGKTVDRSNYTAKSGSTIIIFTESYMNSLSAGTHTIKVNYTDGSTSTSVTVAMKDAANKVITAPQTGDTTPTGWLFALILACGVVLAGITAVSLKKDDVEE